MRGVSRGFSPMIPEKGAVGIKPHLPSLLTETSAHHFTNP